MKQAKIKISNKQIESIELAKQYNGQVQLIALQAALDKDKNTTDYILNYCKDFLSPLAIDAIS